MCLSILVMMVMMRIIVTEGEQTQPQILFALLPIGLFFIVAAVHYFHIHIFQLAAKSTSQRDKYRNSQHTDQTKSTNQNGTTHNELTSALQIKYSGKYSTSL